MTNPQSTDPTTNEIAQAELIRRLRRHCDMEALHIAELKKQVKTLRAERDLLRQNLCKVLDPARPLTAEEMARLCWDCFQNLRLPQFSKTDHRDEHEPYGITPQVEHTEIVPWLRMNAEQASRASHPARRMFWDAADAIKRLTTERDNARREVCRLQEQVPNKEMDNATTLAEDYAKLRGWDCFKEEARGNKTRRT